MKDGLHRARMRGPAVRRESGSAASVHGQRGACLNRPSLTAAPQVRVSRFSTLVSAGKLCACYLVSKVSASTAARRLPDFS
jgi:hypothetical protein